MHELFKSGDDSIFASGSQTLYADVSMSLVHDVAPLREIKPVRHPPRLRVHAVLDPCSGGTGGGGGRGGGGGGGDHPGGAVYPDVKGDAIAGEVDVIKGG